ncbi:MAG: peroxiredoxin family protein [Planctomycetes bacterium]|nr:peroxiredoxin family protein [Planctomycetota bacterium]
MQEKYDAFRKLDTVVIAIAQEDTDLATHGRIRKYFKPEPHFELVADLNGKTKVRYHQTSTYFIDKTGHVREIFPMLIHHRASWEPILNRMQELAGKGN